MLVTNKPFVKEVCTELKSLREKTGFSREEVYHKTQINVGRIERDNVDITLKTLNRLLQFYNSNLESFFREFSMS